MNMQIRFNHVGIPPVQWAKELICGKTLDWYVKGPGNA